MMQVTGTNVSINEEAFQLNGINLDIAALLAKENIDWGSMKNSFIIAPAHFEELLFRVHYKRKKPLTAAERSRVLNFLSIGYLSTDDIRYLNEFLWFYKENDTDKTLNEVCMERFNANLDKKGHHKPPDQLNQYVLDTASSNSNSTGEKTKISLKVGLVGFPPFFGSIIKRLKNEGHHVEQFFLPYHPNRRINSFLKLPIPVKMLTLLSGNFYSYRTLDFDPKDETIGQVLREGNFDIGFHKLNFIIKSNIFNAFKKGLLNDHWGYLPMLRGKSTISYSILFNIPVIPTIHFIEQGVDSGAILGYYPCDYSKAKSVKGIRDILKKKMPERVIAAIQLAGSSNFVPKENKKEAGVTFYEIHPWLSNHIAFHILKQ